MTRTPGAEGAVAAGRPLASQRRWILPRRRRGRRELLIPGKCGLLVPGKRCGLALGRYAAQP